MQHTTDVNYRKQILKNLLESVQKNEQLVIDALYSDFKKPAFEAVLTETNFVISDIKKAIKSVANNAKPKRVSSSLLNFPSADYIYHEPCGNVLIIAPWNYPFQLAMCPMIAAVAAGNSVVLKPSELAPNTANVLSLIIAEVFDPTHVEVYQGGKEVASSLLDRRWDYIFFTGSVAVGKIVAEAAAKYLTPVTLELGGKNPCIVAADADLALSARRIVWGKFVNAGQTCIAPDYLLVHKTIYEKFLALLKQEITSAYGQNPIYSPDFARIIDSKNFDRLTTMLEGEQILFGGEFNAETNYIAPTLIGQPAIASEVMRDEIFGPLLPILTWENQDDIHKIVTHYEKPLSLYVFTTNNSFAEKMITSYSFGGGCVNDTIIHFSNENLPFGGVGNSGMGAYHGKYSFETFSHQKAIVKKRNWFDNPVRYAPYGNKLKWIKKVLKWF